WGLPQAALNHAYSVQLTATSAATWKVAPNSANLPPGLSLSSGGLISGTATSLGFYGFVAIATDQITGMTATKAFGIFVNNPLAITTTTLQDGIVTEGYGQCLSAFNGNGARTWVILSGVLPTGVSLQANGCFTGTVRGIGTFNFTAQV